MSLFDCLCKIKRLRESKVLCGLNGNDFHFFRGGSLEYLRAGIYACNNYYIAHSYNPDQPCWDLKLRFRAPLVIDVARTNNMERYSYYDRLFIRETSLFHKNKEKIWKELSLFISKHKYEYNMPDYDCQGNIEVAFSISSDELLKWCIKNEKEYDIDGLILINVVEGNDQSITPLRFPLIDVMIWHAENIYTKQQINPKDSESVDIWAVSRILLSEFGYDMGNYYRDEYTRVVVDPLTKKVSADRMFCSNGKYGCNKNVVITD